MKKRKNLVDQLFEERADFCEMVDDACNEGTYSRTDGRYQKIVTELLLFSFVILRRLFFLFAFLFGSVLYLLLKG